MARQLFPTHESAVQQVGGVGIDGRGLSPRLWNLVPTDEIFGGGANALDKGYGIFEDFISVSSDTTDEKLITRSGGVEYFIDTGATVLQLGGNESASVTPGFGGVLRLLVDGEDEECGIQFCGTAGEPFYVSDTAANARDLIFECRFRTDTIDANDLNFFIGVAEANMMVADALITDVDTGVMNAVAHIGLLRAEDDPTDGIWCYGANGQTVQEKQAGLIVTSAGTALVADTWYKFGFRYYAGAGVVTPFFDGVAYTADNITSANIAAATFPDGEGMSPVVSIRAGASLSTSESLDIDWIACAQVEAVG